jgi:hypothetical protein
MVFTPAIAKECDNFYKITAIVNNFSDGWKDNHSLSEFHVAHD